MSEGDISDLDLAFGYTRRQRPPPRNICDQDFDFGYTRSPRVSPRNICDQDHDFGYTRSPRVSPRKSYKDLSEYELNRVNSALEVAANFGQPESQDGDSENQYDPRNYKEDRGTKENSLETGPSESETSEAPKILKRSFPFDFGVDEESEQELPSGSSKNHSDDTVFTINLNRKNRHRLETALKLLEFVEGGGNESDSDFDLNSPKSSSLFRNEVSANNTTSTPRVQALKDRTRKKY